MESQKILTSDILDIIFEGKNKLYGAYHLRKTYNNSLVKALLICTGIVAVCWSGLIFFSNEQYKKPFLKVKDGGFGNVDYNKPPEKKLPASKQRSRQQQNVIPVVVNNKKPTDSLQVLNEKDPIGSSTINGPDTSHVGKKIITDLVGTGITLPKETDHVAKVNMEASFPGGIEAWRRYLEKNLDKQVGSDNGAPAGSFTVIVRFAVSSDGNISDVAAETSHGYGLESEAVKIIKKGPKWVPAIQNGNPVNAYRKQPVTFVIEEN